MDNKIFYTFLEEMLELEDSNLNGEQVLDDIEEWDSLAVVSFLAMVDKEYGVTITGDEIANAKTVNDLFNFVQKKL